MQHIRDLNDSTIHDVHLRGDLNARFGESARHPIQQRHHLGGRIVLSDCIFLPADNNTDNSDPKKVPLEGVLLQARDETPQWKVSLLIGESAHQPIQQRRYLRGALPAEWSYLTVCFRELVSERQLPHKTGNLIFQS